MSSTGAGPRSSELQGRVRELLETLTRAAAGHGLEQSPDRKASQGESSGVLRTPTRDSSRGVPLTGAPPSAPSGEPLCAAAGAEALLAHRGEIIAHHRSGAGLLFCEDGGLLAEDQRRPITEDQLWDIASVTKMVTALAALVQTDRGELDLDAPVTEHLPEFGEGPDGRASSGARNRVRIRHLLNHTSGLPAVAQPWAVEGERAKRAAHLLSRPLEREPGIAHVYSCVGYMTLGLTLERITGRRLPDLVAETITEPLGLVSTTYSPPPGRPAAATEYDSTTGRGLVQSQVHDEAAAALGGAGNAGLFSDAHDLFLLGEEIRAGRAGLLRPETRALLRTGTLSPQEVERLGYDQAAGPRLGQDSFMSTEDPAVLGHTGFVGTSLVVDRHHELVVVLLTNAAHPHRGRFSVMPLRRALAEAGRRWVH